MVNSTIRQCVFVAMLVVAAVSTAAAVDRVPTGAIVASIGDDVVVYDAANGAHAAIGSGPVGWLFPAPGGIVFAPDLVNGKTTVVNLKTRRAVEEIDGLTMPHFGAFRDRYVAIGEQVMLVSYPERALMAKVEAEIENPWQVVVTKDGRTVLVLSRRHDGEGGSRLVAVDMVNRKQLYNAELPGDIQDMEFLPGFAVLAMAETENGWLRFMSPGTLHTVGSYAVAGRPVGVESVREDRYVAIAVAQGRASSGPSLRFLKIKRKGNALVVKKEYPVALPADPIALAASPDGQWVVVALDGGQIVIVDAKKREIAAEYAGAGVPRDVVWCDPLSEGPIIETWSDREVDPIELEPGEWTGKE